MCRNLRCPGAPPGPEVPKTVDPNHPPPEAASHLRVDFLTAAENSTTGLHGKPFPRTLPTFRIQEGGKDKLSVGKYNEMREIRVCKNLNILSESEVSAHSLHCIRSRKPICSYF